MRPIMGKCGLRDTPRALITSAFLLPRTKRWIMRWYSSGGMSINPTRGAATAAAGFWQVHFRFVVDCVRAFLAAFFAVDGAPVARRFFVVIGIIMVGDTEQVAERGVS